MFYIDSQRTLTRRESSLVVPKGYQRDDTNVEYDLLSTARGPSTARLLSDSRLSMGVRAKGSVRKEIVTSLFESMLDSIIESWDVIEQHKVEHQSANFEQKTPSETTIMSKKKKAPLVKSSKMKKSRSKIELNDSTQGDLMQLCWWSDSDERVMIRFRNGNIYEGNISMKCMNGEGRFQWADGTVYLGQFKENEMNGKGIIQWKDDTWYEGDFAGNLRHGKGLYVDSRKQSSYTGEWHYGTKHGQGVIYYTGTFKNSYDGEWIKNIRHGFGSREYCEMSGYKGDWDEYIREGKGLMIWPNHDFYRGNWKNGVMSGYGIYIWDAYYNNSMSLPSLCAYRGLWERGKRNGYGLLNLGLGLGAFYKGEFKNNKKHGVGKFVSNNGLILQNKHLFIDDNFGPMTGDEKESDDSFDKSTQLEEPYLFDICDSTVGLIYHVEQVIKNIDKQREIRDEMINDFIESNKILNFKWHQPHEETCEDKNKVDFKDLIDFEVCSLRKSLRCYETDLKNIYYQYATICNKEEIHFNPVLIRLYLWQLYYDCNIHEKRLSLTDIDQIFFANPDWLAKTPHDPFEKVYFWQFQHSLISIASKLYAKRHLPRRKPDTMLASAFRTFMEKDILPGVGRRRGKLSDGYGTYVPLKALYELYHSLGELCTIRTFLCAVRHPPHLQDTENILIENEYRDIGRNAYIYGDEMTFICGKYVHL